jgi:hypothetical protein
MEDAMAGSEVRAALRLVYRAKNPTAKLTAMMA